LLSRNIWEMAAPAFNFGYAMRNKGPQVLSVDTYMGKGILPQQ
jgi:hypothetical protein